MAPPQLDSIVENPIVIRPEHVGANPSKLIVNQRGMSFSGGDITVWSKNSETDAGSRDNNKPPPSYICKGKAASWTQKRTVSDSAGLALFEIYRKSSGVTWFVHVPGHDTQAGDRPLVTLAMERSTFKDKFDICVHGENGEDVQLRVRGQDIWKLRANVYWGDKVVMTTKRQGKFDVYIPGKSLQWEVDVAPGFDTSLATAIMIVLIANLYDSIMKKFSSTGVASGAAIGAGAGAAGGAAA
ncbi:tubby C-terminal-like domain-containing protein [Diaporthe sp. PMI_573]|nr:tubby C-terminal-like domain-containing protein [Diaporthaceae sp. PMI_573]